LCDAETLPGPQDVFTLLHVEEGRGIPVATYGRRASRRDLWVWYFANGDVCPRA
jgi:hypothetical protein